MKISKNIWFSYWKGDGLQFQIGRWLFWFVGFKLEIWRIEGR